jgi:hypothetical protein
VPLFISHEKVSSAEVLNGSKPTLPEPRIDQSELTAPGPGAFLAANAGYILTFQLNHTPPLEQLTRANKSGVNKKYKNGCPDMKIDLSPDFRSILLINPSVGHFFPKPNNSPQNCDLTMYRLLNPLLSSGSIKGWRVIK